MSAATAGLGCDCADSDGRPLLRTDGGATTRGHRSPTEVSVSWRDWQETFLPQFHAAIAEAGALST